MRNLENNINRESDANKESNANRRSLSSTSSQDIAPDEAPAGRPHVRRKSYIPGDYETKVALDKYTKQDEQLATVDGEQGDSAETWPYSSIHTPLSIPVRVFSSRSYEAVCPV